jgi:hypothetical protein
MAGHGVMTELRDMTQTKPFRAALRQFGRLLAAEQFSTSSG